MARLVITTGGDVTANTIIQARAFAAVAASCSEGFARREFVPRLKRLTPVRTGRLRAGVKVESTGNGFRVGYIGVRYAPYVRRAVRAHRKVSGELTSLIVDRCATEALAIYRVWRFGR